MLTKKFLDDMRENGYMLVDAQMRKIAVFPNEGGEVVIAVDEDGMVAVATMETTEVDKFLELFMAAFLEAAKIRFDQVSEAGV